MTYRPDPSWRRWARGLLAAVAALVLAGTTTGPVVTAAAAPTVPGPAVLPLGYRATPLISTTGQMFYPSTSGNPINARDRIAGVVLTPLGQDFQRQAAVFSVRNRTVRLLNPPGSIWATAVDINRRGQVTGTAVFRDREQAYRWSPSTDTYQLLGSLGGYFARPAALNDSGVVVGSSADESFGEHAFVSDPQVDGGRMQDLGVLPGDPLSGASAVNNAGDVVGWSGNCPTCISRAFFWSRTTPVMTDLGHVAGDNATWATDINDRGYIVGGTGYVPPGGSEDPVGLSRAFLISPSTRQFQLLPSRRDQAAVAHAINRRGVIVGTSTSPGQSDQALIWSACGRSVTVLIEDQYGTSAVGINRHEHVVGSTFKTGTFWRRTGPCPPLT